MSITSYHFDNSKLAVMVQGKTSPLWSGTEYGQQRVVVDICGHRARTGRASWKAAVLGSQMYSFQNVIELQRSGEPVSQNTGVPSWSECCSFRE
jgi:hypothetical protein